MAHTQIPKGATITGTDGLSSHVIFAVNALDYEDPVDGWRDIVNGVNRSLYSGASAGSFAVATAGGLSGVEAAVSSPDDLMIWEGLSIATDITDSCSLSALVYVPAGIDFLTSYLLAFGWTAEQGNPTLGVRPVLAGDPAEIRWAYLQTSPGGYFPTTTASVPLATDSLVVISVVNDAGSVKVYADTSMIVDKGAVATTNANASNYGDDPINRIKARIADPAGNSPYVMSIIATDHALTTSEIAALSNDFAVYLDSGAAAVGPVVSDPVIALFPIATRWDGNRLSVTADVGDATSATVQLTDGTNVYPPSPINATVSSGSISVDIADVPNNPAWQARVIATNATDSTTVTSTGDVLVEAPIVSASSEV